MRTCNHGIKGFETKIVWQKKRGFEYEGSKDQMYLIQLWM